MPEERRPSLKGFVLHGHFEGSDRLAYKFQDRKRTPVPGAQISIWGPQSEVTFTDANGEYKFFDLMPGEYHIRVERGPVPGLSTGGYLPVYDKVAIPEKVKRERVNWATKEREIVEVPAHTVTKDFELTPIESAIHHKVSFSGGRKATRDRIRNVLGAYKNMGTDRQKVNERLEQLYQRGHISDTEFQSLVELFRHDSNALKNEMLKKELEILKRSDKTLDIKNVRYIPSAIGKVNIFSTVGDKFKSGLVTNIGLLIAGMAFSAIVGSPLFVFAFLCWIVYNVLPTPNDSKHIQDRIAQIDEHYANMKKSEEYYKAGPDAAARLEEQRKNDIMITMSMIREFGLQDLGVSAVLKESLKVIGFALFSIAFILSSIPFAKPLGVVIAIVAYMAIRYKKEDTGLFEVSRGKGKEERLPDFIRRSLGRSRIES